MAAVDYFLKIDGIEGEAQDKTHKNEIQLESFSWGETNAGSMGAGGGGGSGKVAMQDFHFVMTTNKASPKLFLACATGDHIKNAILVCRKAGKDQQEYLKYTFTDLLISSYQIGGRSRLTIRRSKWTTRSRRRTGPWAARFRRSTT
jgi:type VI secretion system secreted protein Hcp